jgi:hypothetical protein
VKAKEIETGKIYRLRNSPDHWYVRPVEIIRPGTWQMKTLAKSEGIKPFEYIVVKCEHIPYKDAAAGLIRYFRPADIIREKEPGRGNND